ncbi:MAG: GspH/FimT family pseudopilin [Sulfuricella denitrificans]|nr:GspH/FimT family pseudopilin [Sulfuricella denitrificans]
MLPRNRGFTLIELLVVMVIIGLAYSLVPPLFSSGATGTELKAATRQLAAGLRKARSEAILRKREVALAMDVEKRQFNISGEGRVYSLSSKVAVNLHTAQSELFSGQGGNIRFFPDGSSTGGRITLAARDVEYRIDVDWMTGRVAISE